METLLTKQKMFFKKLISLEQNVRKKNESDGQPAALKRHLKCLKDDWDQFESNDEKLKAFEDFSDDYFTQDIFNKVKALYNNYVQLISNELATGTMPKIQQDPNEYEDREVQERQWGLAKDNDHQIQDQVDKIMSLMKSTTKIDSVEQFPKYQLPIEQIFGNSMDTARSSTSFSFALPAKYFSLGVAPAMLPQFENSQQKRIENSQNQSDQLAQIIDLEYLSIELALQKFDGNPQEYRYWRQLFKMKVHDKAIPNRVKLKKLKLALPRQAYRLISNIDNYEKALAIIDAKYYVPQKLMDRQVDDFLKILDSNFGNGKSDQQIAKEIHDITQRVFGNLSNIVQDIYFPRIEDRQQPNFKEMVFQEIFDTLVSRIITSTFDRQSNKKLQKFRLAKGITKHQLIKLADVMEFLQQ